MRKWVRVSTLLLLSFMLVLAACSKSDGGSNSNTGSNTGNNNTENTGSNAGSQDDGKIEELVVAFPAISPNQEDLKMVENAINEITKTKIKATIKFLPINAGEWQQRMNLIFSGNEKLDLTFVHGLMYSNMVAKGQLVALDDLIAEHGSGIHEALGDKYLNSTKLNGKIYSVPTVRDLAGSYGINMRKDLVDKHNIDVSKIKTLDDVADVLRMIKENEPDVTPLVPGAPTQSFRDNYVFVDPLGDNFGVLPNYDNDLQVVNLFEMPEYEAFIHRIRDWYVNGYILKDAATNQIQTYELINSGKAFAYIGIQKPGSFAQESILTGTEIVGAQLIEPIATTSAVTSAMWGIPINTKLQDKAMQFLNLMYSDKEIINLIVWGIEGTHYEKVSDNVIAYPEGKDVTTVGYNMLGWMFGNQFLTYVMENDDPDIWKKTEEYNAAAKPSKALGFIFDQSAIKTEFAAVSSVIQQYKLPLETGSVDPEKLLPEFISKLKDAGIDTIIAEKQKQLDEWAKANSVQ